VLTHANVARYLCERGLLRRAAEAGVLDASGRNRVFVVSLRAGGGFVVKQSEDRDETLLPREAGVLRRVVAAEPRLAGRVPTAVSYDGSQHILVYELLGDSMDLGAYHARGRFPPLLAREVGRALALLHRLGPATVDGYPVQRDDVLPGIPRDPPTLDQMLRMSDAAVRLLALLQRATELRERLAELQASGETVATVHGDARPSNCVAFPPPGTRRRTRVALVDWELARAGDPHIDLGTVLAEYLHTWLWSIPVIDGAGLPQAPRYARRPLRAMQPAIGAFWLAYTDTGPPASLRRAIEFAAGHLVAVSFERAQTQPTLDPRAGLALQLSLNLLRRPTEAAAHLFGLDPLAGAP